MPIDFVKRKSAGSWFDPAKRAIPLSVRQPVTQIEGHNRLALELAVLGTVRTLFFWGAQKLQR